MADAEAEEDAEAALEPGAELGELLEELGVAEVAAGVEAVVGDGEVTEFEVVPVGLPEADEDDVAFADDAPTVKGQCRKMIWVEQEAKCTVAAVNRYMRYLQSADTDS